MRPTPWAYVFVGGLLETVCAVSMKMSEGLTDPFYTVITLIFLFASTYLLYCGIRKGVPVGVGYAVWVGIGAVCSVIMGIILFEETLAIGRLFFISLIIAGVVGLQVTESKTDPECPG
jgi:quaternary ammonium compound-resistance protein SugE